MKRVHFRACPVDARERFLDVQGPRLARGIAAAPVEQAKRGVTVLLQLGEKNALTYRVDRAGRQEHAIPGARLERVQTVDDRPTLQCLAQLALANAFSQSGVDATPRIRVEDEPCFRLAAFSWCEPGRLLVVRM